MLLSRLALGALLLAASLPGHAQAPASAAPAAPRFYVGLAAYHSNYQNLAGKWKGNSGFRVPVQLTAGYQLRPRLALELGMAYCGQTTSYTDDGYLYTDEFGTLARYQSSTTITRRTTSVSALARYTLTRQPAHRLQVDALGGFTLLHGSFHSRGFRTYDNAGTPETATFTYRTSSNDLLLTGGLGLRYRLTPRLGLNFDITTNYNLTTPTVFNDGFSGSAALGLRYRFRQ